MNAELMHSNFKFKWGQLVQISSDAPEDRKGQLGSIVGMRDKDGVHLYTIEFGDGHDQEVSEAFLRPHQE
jgi:hypothetical protein